MSTLSPQTKHLLRHYAEMVVAMFLGMAVLGYPVDWVMGRLGANSDEFMCLTDLGELMDIEHVAMLLAMAGVMLLRPAEYLHRIETLNAERVMA